VDAPRSSRNDLSAKLTPMSMIVCLFASLGFTSDFFDEEGAEGGFVVFFLGEGTSLGFDFVGQSLAK
jgi:hypothetical protein